MNNLAEQLEEIGRQLDANAGALLALHVILARLLGIFHFDEVLLASTKATLDQMRDMLVCSHASAYKIDSFDATAETLLAILTVNHFHRNK